MARVVADVIPSYGHSVTWEKIITKELAGARRYAELSQKAGRPMPVPSIIINGELVFDAIPSVEELRRRLDADLEEAKK